MSNIKIVQLGCALLGEGDCFASAIENALECDCEFTEDCIDNDYSDGLTPSRTIFRNNIGDAIIVVDTDNIDDEMREYLKDMGVAN